MMRNLTLVALTLVVGLSLASIAEAQVFVRAPFVRVQVGGGVYVRAPFVNLWIPPPPVYYVPNAYVPAMPRVVESPMPQSVEPQPQTVPQQQPVPQQLPVPQQQPVPNNDSTPSPLTKTEKALTLEQFANSFQAKGGNYEVSIVSPVTNQATQVRFTLPDGNPRRIHVRRQEIEFDYGFRHFVRIEFDNEGAMVTSR
jgi:hypothetical protein